MFNTVFKTGIFLFLLQNIFNAATAQLVFTATVKRPSCQTVHGHNLNGINIGNGAINITATGGTSPYTYTITGSYTTTRTQNNGYFPQLYEALYTITATDATGLFKDTAINLVATNPIPTIDNPVINYPSGCNTNDGTITLNTLTGTPPFLFTIDGGATYSSNNVFNISQGGYICHVKDANGCISFSATNAFFPSDPACGIWAYSTRILTACGNDAEQQLLTITPEYDSAIKISYDGIQYRLPNAGFNLYGAALDTISGLASGIHPYYLKDTITGTTAKGAFAVGVSCELYITFVGVDATCGKSDGSLTVQQANGVPPYTYTIDGINFQNSNIITGLASGNYCVAVKDATGAISSAIGTVYNKCPKVSVDTGNISCIKNYGTITAHGVKGTRPYSFSLDGVNFQTDSFFTSLAAGLYKLTLKDANGFIDTAVVSIFNQCIIITNSVTDEICNLRNGTITVNATGGTPPYLYGNDVNGSFIFSQFNIIRNVPAGIYNIVVADSYFITDTIQVIVGNGMPSLTLGNDTTICPGQQLVLHPSLTDAFYIWQDGSDKDSLVVTGPGRYSVSANKNGCVVTDEINIAYLSGGSVFSTDSVTVCAGSSFAIDAGNSGSAFLWDDNSIGQTRVVSSSGKYWVLVKSGACSVSDTIVCNFITAEKTNLPKNTSFCEKKSLVLNAGNTGTVYLWSTGETSNSITVSQKGKYWVSVKDNNGCSSSDTVNVTTRPNPFVFLGKDTVLCEGQTLQLNANYLNSTYLWQDGNINNSYTVTKQGLYDVKVIMDGCEAGDTIKVEYILKPVFSLGEDKFICSGQYLILQANVSNADYLWQDGSSSQNYTVTQPGLYTVTVANECGETKDSVLISQGVCELYVPSAFTPNTDGRNDTFKPSFGENITQYNLKIFNRYGQLLFESSDKGKGWDGRYKGTIQLPASYVWFVEYRTASSGSLKQMKGMVTLIR